MLELFAKYKSLRVMFYAVLVLLLCQFSLPALIRAIASPVSV